MELHLKVAEEVNASSLKPNLHNSTQGKGGKEIMEKEAMKAELCRILNKIGALKFGAFKRAFVTLFALFSLFLDSP